MFYGKPRSWINQPYLWLGLVVLLLSCSLGWQPVQSESPPGGPAIAGQPQSLPIEAVATIDTTRINLEVARTPDQQELGLMHRTALADDQGMLFPFQPPRPVGFWMKNCLISLDIVFMRLGKVVAIAANSPPCTEEPCPIYPSGAPIDQVIELRGGRAAELGLKIGDPIGIEFL